MFLNEKQAEERLGSEKNLARAPFLKREQEVTPQVSERVIERVIPLPGKNRINLTKEERTEIATRARLGESQKALMREFEVNQQTVSNITNGKVKGIDKDKIEQTIVEVKDRALDRLMHTLGLLTDDKLSGCSAKDLSVIASNMGRVVERTSPKEERPDGLTFIIYAPELKQERAYDVVEI
jgi:hypothetical protein